jgi:N utilization substance protein A
MASPLYETIEVLSRDKGIDPQIVVGAVEDAIALATRKYYKTLENMRGELDRETGEIRAYAYKTVVESPKVLEDPLNQINLDDARAISPDVEVGGELRYYKDTAVLGRIAAQMAKQIIFQKVREAERDTVFNEYAHRVGEVLNATVKRIEGQDVILDIGKAEARMPKREQSRLEQFAVGERIRVVLLRVDRNARGPQVIVSRAAKELVQNLFQSEVPEIYDNTVEIRAIAREAGERTKIAVVSRDKDVDPVGACVGMKGMRVQSIIRELRGEKIDIIEHSEEVTTFAEKALQPAKVSRVSIVDLAEKQLEVIVDDTQLSLAIGKKGQNVRLAAKLLGWKIDIKSEEEKRLEVEQQMQAMAAPVTTPLEQVADLGEGIIQKLVAAGITTVEALADMTPEQIQEVPGIGEKTLEKIGNAVRNYFAELDNRADAGPTGETSAQEDANEAALDREAGAGSETQAADENAPADAESASEQAAEAATEETESEPGELPIPDEASVTPPAELPDEADDAEGREDSQSLVTNVLEEATATDNEDQPANVDAPDPREPALDRWEEKEEP